MPRTFEKSIKRSFIKDVNLEIQCSISLGELVDKISILKVKQLNITDTEKLKFIESEKTTLEDTLNKLHLEGIDDYLQKLQAVNSNLWKIEDDIRDKERSKEFDEQFVALARSVYQVNDERFAIKNKVNEFYGSSLKEMKSYKKYD
jgi:hypothetical protein